jgi:hypothetical protein
MSPLTVQHVLLFITLLLCTQGCRHMPLFFPFALEYSRGKFVPDSPTNYCLHVAGQHRAASPPEGFSPSPKIAHLRLRSPWARSFTSAQTRGLTTSSVVARPNQPATHSAKCDVLHPLPQHYSERSGGVCRHSVMTGSGYWRF